MRHFRADISPRDISAPNVILPRNTSRLRVSYLRVFVIASLIVIIWRVIWSMLWLALLIMFRDVVMLYPVFDVEATLYSLRYPLVLAQRLLKVFGLDLLFCWLRGNVVRPQNKRRDPLQLFFVLMLFHCKIQLRYLMYLDFHPDPSPNHVYAHLSPDFNIVFFVKILSIILSSASRTNFLFHWRLLRYVIRVSTNWRRVN